MENLSELWEVESVIAFLYRRMRERNKPRKKRTLKEKPCQTKSK